MIVRTHSFKMIAALALVTMTAAGLASCGGGGSRSVSGNGGSPPVSRGSGDQMRIMPQPSTLLPTQQQSQGQPDLGVGPPSVSESSPETGASFTLSAAVNNKGRGASEATTLRYYRSADATITNSDTEVGSEALTGLAASGSSNGSVDLAAPSNPGAYYYGACVDAVTEESNATNNCSASVKVDVGAPKYPNLEVGTAAVTDTSPAAGAAFTLSATVSNTGDGASEATTLRYYRSADATVTNSDTAVGTEAVGTLSASGSSSGSVDLTAPMSPGTYNYGACVDAVTDESNTTDNCSSSMEVTVPVTQQQLQGAPDLEVGAPTVSDTSPETGAAFTLSATVSNTGDGASAATTLRYYRSADAAITASDTAVGTDDVGVLSASGTSAEAISLTAPFTAGTYYYGACVDTVTDESDPTDNCSDPVKVDVEAPKYPDLVVGSPMVSDDGPGPGGSFTLSAAVSNTGDGASAATTLRYYRSADATITASDTAVGTDDVGVLSASGTSAEAISLTAPFTAGTYYYGACVDAVTDESDRTDNCSDSVKVDVEAPKYPDLVVGTPTVSDDGPGPGGSFTLSATVSNRGDGASVATLRYYRSADATITTADTAVGTDDVGLLSASGSSAESISLTAPLSPGPYYYGACVDEVADELNTTNNCSPSVEVTVLQTLQQQAQPDLVVGSPLVSDSTPETGASLTLAATVSNTGGAASAATTLRYYRSADATIAASDTAVGTDDVGVLSASGTSAELISLTAPSTAGTYYYGACVDGVTDESNTANNCSPSVEVTVHGTVPTDLEMIGAATTSNSSPAAGATFSLSATVRNAGGLESDIMLMTFYRSTDATITTSDTEAGFDGVGTLQNGWVHKGLVSLQAPTTLGAYYYGACVWSRDESDYTNNCSTSVLVDVVARQANTPDLVIPKLYYGHFTDGLIPGEEVRFYVQLKNEGDATSPAATVRIYRSNDSTISTDDQEVASGSAEAVGPGATSKEYRLRLWLPSSVGTYYYGACVDGVAGESDTTNNCFLDALVLVVR